MRIVNNRIYIAKGETPTYSARIIDRDSGAPFIIDKAIALNKDGSTRRVYIEFVVRDNAYARDEDKRIRKHLLISESEAYHVFDDLEIKPYPGFVTFPDGKNPVWDNTKPLNGNENRLHRYTDKGDNFYCYYDGSKWVDYDFDFNTTFTYEETSVMEPKTYKYEIALLAGRRKADAKEGELPITIEFKKQLLGLTDFTVEGSISE
jgi:hypothetical protein